MRSSTVETLHYGEKNLVSNWLVVGEFSSGRSTYAFDNIEDAIAYMKYLHNLDPIYINVHYIKYRNWAGGPGGE